MIDKTEEVLAAQARARAEAEQQQLASQGHGGDGSEPSETDPLVPPSYTSDPIPTPSSSIPPPIQVEVPHGAAPYAAGPITPVTPTMRHYRYHKIPVHWSRQARRRADARARERFIKALAIGLFIWLVAGFGLAWVGLEQGGRRREPPRYGGPARPPPSDGTPTTCDNFKPTYPPPMHLPRGFKSSTRYFSLPSLVPDSDLFFVHGVGSFSNGEIRYVVEEPVERGKAGKDGGVEVQVEARFNDERLVELMSVCEMVRGGREGVGKEVGVGIYTPTPEIVSPQSQLHFLVTVRISPDTRQLAGLELRVPIFSVDGEDLSNVLIDRVDLESGNSRIKIQKLLAKAARVRTSNGEISGTYNVSNSLSITTSNGQIDARVALFPPLESDGPLPLPPNPPKETPDPEPERPPRGRPDRDDRRYPYPPRRPPTPPPPPRRDYPHDHDHDRFPHLDEVDADEADEDEGATTTTASDLSTSVIVSTTNGSIDLEYIEHPAEQELHSYVQSTNGRVQVRHTTAFEGDFEVETTWGKGTFAGPFKRQSRDDPSGKGRTRRVEVRRDDQTLGYRHLVGTVWWTTGDSDKDADRRGRGDSKARTTLGAAGIRFA